MSRPGRPQGAGSAHDEATAVGAAGERVFIGLGANLGDARATVEAALATLDQLPGTRCVARSALYRSAPVQASGPDYVNAVAELRTVLAPAALLAALQEVERRFGRERPHHHAPRTLDLDLLLYGERIVQDAALTLPHPRLHLRAFVLEPLAELAPDLRLPALGPLDGWRRAAAGQAVQRLAP